jgi:hypothetical protein
MEKYSNNKKTATGSSSLRGACRRSTPWLAIAEAVERIAGCTCWRWKGRERPHRRGSSDARRRGVLATVAETGSSSFERRAGVRQRQAREERRRRALRRGWISGEVERRLRADKVVAFCGASRNRSGMGTVWKKLLTSGPAMKRS